MVFFNICVPFPFQNKENWKCLFTSTNISALCLDFDEVSANLQSPHIRALLSKSSQEMKFDSSSWYVKAGLLRFWDTVRVFFANHTFCLITSTFAETNKQKNHDDSFETRHFDEGRPCDEPSCTSLVQRSRMLMQKRTLFVTASLWFGCLCGGKVVVVCYVCVAAGLYSFVWFLCGYKLVVLFYACVAASL